MRMPQELQVFNLTLDPTRHVATDELLARNNLEGHLLIGDAVYGQLHLAEGALTESTQDLVLADALGLFILRGMDGGGSGERGSLGG